MIESIKTRRLMIDRLITYAETYKYSGYTTLALCSLQLAKSRLGLVLRDFGQMAPYKVVSEATEIPPTTDVFEQPDQEEPTYDTSDNDGRLFFLNEQREGIANAIEDCGNIPLTKDVSQCILELENARFWYGFALGELRDAAQTERQKEQQGSYYKHLENNGE